MIDMKHKHATPQMMVYKILNFEGNRANVEFPGLKGYTQEQLEVIVQNLFKAESIKTIGGAFIDDVKLDLWGLEVEKQLRSDERAERKKARKAAGDIGFEKEMGFNEEELFEHLRKEKENSMQYDDRNAQRISSKERYEAKQDSKEEKRRRKKEMKAQKKKLLELELEQIENEMAGKINTEL